MDFKCFNYDKFLKFQEEKNKNFNDFLAGNFKGTPVMQVPVCEQYGSLCNTKEKSLNTQLDYLDDYTKCKTDLAFGYLEPWHGVGIYAAAFGCEFIMSEHTAPQTLPVYNSVDEVIHIKKPSVKNCEHLMYVLEMIKYFKEKTGSMLPIAITDTQSPNDTASLVLDACEFLASLLSEPESVEPLLNAITDAIIDFTEMQIGEIGDCLVCPGHIMVCGKEQKGISLSDDNMSFLSPDVYTQTSLIYNQRLSRHFGGVAIHSCGNIAGTAGELLKTDGLYMVDCAVGKTSDPTPNDPVALKEIFEGSGKILKVRLGAGEIDNLKPLVESEVMLIVQLELNGTIEEKNKEFERCKDIINKL